MLYKGSVWFWMRHSSYKIGAGGVCCRWLDNSSIRHFVTLFRPCPVYLFFWICQFVVILRCTKCYTQGELSSFFNSLLVRVCTRLLCEFFSLILNASFNIIQNMCRRDRLWVIRHFVTLFPPYAIFLKFVNLSIRQFVINLMRRAEVWEDG